MQRDHQVHRSRNGPPGLANHRAAERCRHFVIRYGGLEDEYRAAERFSDENDQLIG